MRYDAYYVFRANRRLVDAVQDFGTLGELLIEPQLWVNTQGGREIALLTDYLAAMKTLYTAHVRQKVRCAGKLDHVLANLEPGEEAFDIWWNVEVFDGVHENAAAVLTELCSDRDLGSATHGELQRLRRWIKD